MIQARNISLSFGEHKIFDHNSFIINDDDRIGLVGRNGSGKTTLLKAIIDQSCLDEGTVSIQKGKKIAYMPQEVVLQSARSILDETLTSFSALQTIHDEIKALEAHGELSNPEILERYSNLQEQLAQISPEMLAAQAKQLLMGLGFSAEQFEQPVAHLSVGWKMRIVLAKLLLQKADFYLFDEPTNHLDLTSKEWFLDFLKHAEFGFILICHERYFLDELCQKIIELDRGHMTWYTGNYSGYLVKKEHDLELLQAAYVQQQKEIKRKQTTIERFRASASKSRMALSMEKALEKVELIELPTSIKSIQFSFPPIQQSGKEVLTVKNVAQKFGAKTIFQHVSFLVTRGQKVALIAPNGVGKTTLFNSIAGILPVQHGSVEFGYNVSYAIFAQDQNKVLDPKLTILDNLQKLCPQVSEQKIRALLGAFLFSGDDVLKKVAVLSGGEKNRVGMVSVLLQQTNLLLLDEPTNHLDIQSKEILLKALQEFKGTIIFVSHDRDFINDLATDIIELTPRGTHQFQGNYDDYKYHQQALAEKTEITKTIKPAAKAAAGTKHSADHELKKSIQKTESTITKLEQQIEKLNLSFIDLEYGTPAFDQAVTKLETLKKQLKETEKQWEQLQQQMLDKK